MGSPGQLQETPHIAALLPQARAHRQQPRAAKTTAAGLDAVTDLALNHRLPQRPLGTVVGGLYPWFLQKCPQGLLALVQLLAGTHRVGPRRSFSLLVAQIHYPLQRLLKLTTDRPAVMLQLVPVDLAVLPVIPELKQLTLQLQQRRSELSAGS